MNFENSRAKIEYDMETEIFGEAKVPSWMVEFIVGVMLVEYGPSKPRARVFPCLILKKELESKLPGFVGYNEEEELLFISEEVPERFRLPILHHELAEAHEFAGQEGRCLKAFESELFYAGHMGYDYFPYRKQFFTRLVAFYSGSEQHPNQEFIKEITATRDHLQKNYSQ